MPKHAENPEAKPGEHNKVSWGPGPWQKEPDRYEWRYNGMACLAVRGTLGNWCGYAGVPSEHPWHGKDYSDCLLPGSKPRGRKPGDSKPLKLLGRSISLPKRLMENREKRIVCQESYCDHTPESKTTIHGGLTFAGACHGSICHAPKPGEPDNVWWFGFDCAHLGDLVPSIVAMRKKFHLEDPIKFKSFGSYSERDVYWTLRAVKKEVELLAEQLIVAGKRLKNKTRREHA